MRISPSDSATLYNIGYIKKGNDNNMWIIVTNKNGTKRWKKIRNIKALYNNNKFFLKMIHQLDKKKNNINELISSSYKWAEILSPIAKKLLKSGILLFIYPMGYYFTDYAEEDNLNYIRNNKDILKYYEKHHNIKLNAKNDIFYDEVFKVPYIYYLATNSTTLCLKHNLPGKKVIDDCFDVFKKHFKAYFRWNKSHNKAICISSPENKNQKESKL